MMMYEDILIEPVLSEKATMLREENKYVFKVSPFAKVVDCTVMNVGGKKKRVRYRTGKTSSWKKAIVKLAPGETIKVFEGV